MCKVTCYDVGSRILSIGFYSVFKAFISSGATIKDVNDVNLVDNTIDFDALVGNNNICAIDLVYNAANFDVLVENTFIVWYM